MPASADADPDADTGAATDARPAVAAGARRSADDALTELWPARPGSISSCSRPGAPRADDAAADRTRSDARNSAPSRPTSRARPLADPIVRRLQTVHGIGPVLGLMLRAEIGDVAAFRRRRIWRVMRAWCPQVDSSASRTHYGRITKDGSPWLRWALVEVGVQTLRRRDPLGRWGRKLAVRKGAHESARRTRRAKCVGKLWTTWRRVA